MRTNNEVFISYAHEDASWRDEFRTMFKPAVDRGSISLWSDGDIAVGKDWSRSIDGALASASAGLLLVTRHFLNSEFITDVELKRLLGLAKTEGIAIYWVPISAALYKETPLASIQAAWNPEQPLESLTQAAQHEAVQHICLQIVEDCGFLPKVTGGRRLSLPQTVQARLGDEFEIGDEVGAGKRSIFYKAQQRDPRRTVGVKVLVASEFDDWVSQRFQEAAERGAVLKSPAFIRTFKTSMDVPPQFLVTEFIQGEPLSKYLLRYPNGVPLRAVQSILLALASAIEEVHRNDSVRGEMCSSDILIEPTGGARLSPVDFSTVLAGESRMAGNFLVDRESLAYMTPERFFGHAFTQQSDQYSLGLIAMELLGGERVPRVTSPSDLEGKRQFFTDLQAGRGAWAERSREFAGIVTRMLHIEPTARWPSMRDIRHFLRDIEVAESEEERYRKAARRSYVRLQAAGGERDLFKRFYENLFAACEEVKPYFERLDMHQQYRLVNNAILLLLDFDSSQGSTALRDLAVRHAPLGLTKRHYDLFLESLLTTLEAWTLDQSEIMAWRKTLVAGVDFMCACQGPATPAEKAQSLGV
jgi:hemoglobin-like flavoprotein